MQINVIEIPVQERGISAQEFLSEKQFPAHELYAGKWFFSTGKTQQPAQETHKHLHRKKCAGIDSDICTSCVKRVRRKIQIL